MPAVDLTLMIRRLDGELVVALEEAVGIAVRHGNSSVELEHWIAGCVAKSPNFKAIVEAAGGDLSDIEESAYRGIERYGRGEASAPSISPAVIDVTREGWLYASLQHGRERVDVLDLLYATLSDGNLRSMAVGSVPPLRDIRLGELEKLLAERPQGGELPAGQAAALGGTGDAHATGAGPGQFLQSYTIDMTEQARAGKLDPVVGRDAEMRQIVDILVRRRQNNPILVGEAGVGKTAVVEAFAIEVEIGRAHV